MVGEQLLLLYFEYRSYLAWIGTKDRQGGAGERTWTNKRVSWQWSFGTEAVDM